MTFIDQLLYIYTYTYTVVYLFYLNCIWLIKNHEEKFINLIIKIIFYFRKNKDFLKIVSKKNVLFNLATSDDRCCYLETK